MGGFLLRPFCRARCLSRLSAAIVASLTTLTFGASCLFRNVHPPWPTTSVKGKVLVLYPEPGIPESIVRTNLEDGESILKEYEHFFDYTPPDRSVHIFLYKSRKSYEKSVPLPVDTNAFYERRSHTIHIPVNSTRNVWRHELSHAVLENAVPGTPFWLQEGLALFLQENRMERFTGCDTPQVAHLGEAIKGEIPLLSPGQRLPLLLDFHHEPGAAVRYDSVYSALFVLFIWKKRMLTPMLRYYIHNRPAAPEYYITRGNDREWDRILSDFQKWIRKGADGASSDGC